MCDPPGFRGWIEYLKLAIPGMMALCLEWWAFEVVALMAGLLKDSHVALGAHTVGFKPSFGLFYGRHGLIDALVMRDHSWCSAPPG